MATILHVDMDAFFASVELLRHPEWRGRPLVVGSGPHERGVVSTCSYEARKFGIHSAMPSRTAYTLCPHAIFTPPDMAHYSSVSRKAFEVFGHYSPYVEAVSVDEAFLDITGTIHLFGSARALGEALRAEIRRVCGVTCSVGIATNRLLAKIGSEENKPDGLTVMPFEPEAVARFLAQKKIGVLWGVGRKTAELLKTYGITTCCDLQKLSVEELTVMTGSVALAESLHAHAFGISSDRVAQEESEEKSVSREHTFGEDEPSREIVRATRMHIVDKVGTRFRRERRWAATARLKLRDADFRTITRQEPFDAPARDDMSLREKALSLFNAAWPERETFRAGSRAIRLVGFGVTNIQKTPCAVTSQPTLFESDADATRAKRERLSEALDALRTRGMAVSHAAPGRDRDK